MKDETQDHLVTLMVCQSMLCNEESLVTKITDLGLYMQDQDERQQRKRREWRTITKALKKDKAALVRDIERLESKIKNMEGRLCGHCFRLKQEGDK